MSLTFTSTPSTKFEVAPEGATLGRCYRILDLGTQVLTWQGEEKMVHQVSVWFELPNELTADNKPKIISSTYTCSLGEKSKLRPVVSALTGKNLPDYFEQFDLKTILGCVAVVDIIHKPNKNGGVNAFVNSVSKVLKGTEVKEAFNEPVFFDLARFDNEVFNKLPKYYQEKIAQSPEYNQAIEGLSEKKVVVSKEKPSDSDIPF